MNFHLIVPRLLSSICLAFKIFLCFFIGSTGSVQVRTSQYSAQNILKWIFLNYGFICSVCFPLATLFFSCLLSGLLSHLPGPIIRLITPVSVIPSSSLDLSSVQKIQRPCQHRWTLVPTWDSPSSHNRILWMWVWFPEFLCTHFTVIMEISYKGDLFCWILF